MSRHLRRTLTGVVLIVLAFGAGFGGALAFLRWHELTDLRDHGKSAPGTVTKTDVDLTGRNATDVIYYDFQADGERNRRTGVVRLTRGRTGKVDMTVMSGHFYKDALTVRYRQDRPDVFCLELLLDERIASARTESLIFLALFAVLGLTGIAFVTLGLAGRRPRRGRAAPRS